jgi:hypothetical protein
MLPERRIISPINHVRKYPSGSELVLELNWETNHPQTMFSMRIQFDLTLWLVASPAKRRSMFKAQITPQVNALRTLTRQQAEQVIIDLQDYSNAYDFVERQPVITEPVDAEPTFEE